MCLDFAKQVSIGPGRSGTTSLQPSGSTVRGVALQLFGPRLTNVGVSPMLIRIVLVTFRPICAASVRTSHEALDWIVGTLIPVRRASSKV
jgi:hypothetical protein